MYAWESCCRHFCTSGSSIAEEIECGSFGGGSEDGGGDEGDGSEVVVVVVVEEMEEDDEEEAGAEADGDGGDR